MNQRTLRWHYPSDSAPRLYATASVDGYAENEWRDPTVPRGNVPGRVVLDSVLQYVPAQYHTLQLIAVAADESQMCAVVISE